MKKICNFLLGFFSIIICLLLTFSLIIKKEFKPETIQNTLVNTDFSFIIDSMKEEDKELLDNIEEALTYLNIPNNIVEKLLNSPGTKNFIGLYLSNTVNYFLHNEENIPLTGKDLENLIKSNLDIIQSELPNKDKAFLEEYENNLYKLINENEQEILNFFPEPKELFKDIDLNEFEITENITLKDLTNFISFFTSTSFILILISSLILIYSLLIVINLKTKKYLPTIANSLFTYFIIILSIQIGIYIVEPIIINELPALNVFINNINIQFWICIAISLILCIILRVLYHTLKHNLNKLN